MSEAGPDPALSSILVQSSLDGLFAVDRDLRYTLWNAAMERFTGRRAADLLGRHVFDVFPELRGTPVGSFFERALAGETVTPARVAYAMPNGETRHIDRVYMPLRDARGEIAGVQGVAFDVTERTLAEDALRQSEAKLRVAVEAGGVGLWSWDVEGDEVRWEDTLCAIFGLPAGSAPKTRGEYLAMIHPEDRERALSTIRNGVRDGRWENSNRILRADGAVRWMLSKGAISAIDGRRVAFGALIDVTEQRQREEHARQAQKLEAVGQLTAGIAHNFNNLLMAMTANLEIAASRAPSELAPLLQDVQGAAVRAADLVRQLMTFAGRNVPSATKSVEPIAALVARTVAFCRTTLDRRIALEERYDETLRARVDVLQLEQALLNIVLNARDAVEGPHVVRPCITISVDAVGMGEPELRGHTGEHVRIRVQDNGPGMDSSTLARIFEPFFTTKEVGKGTGLGLATTHAIVREHGGFIACDSTLGRGATFSVYLERVADPAHERASAPAGQVASGGAETILVVDDERAVRAVVALMLESVGYTVMTAASGQEAVELLSDPAKASAVSLLLLDVSMPGLAGPALRRRIAELAPRARVVIFTGCAPDATESDDLVLEKPVSLQRLVDTVRTAIDRPMATR